MWQGADHTVVVPFIPESVLVSVMGSETQRWDACCALVLDAARMAGAVQLRVTGASMMPCLWPGDMLTVRSCDAPELQPGQIVVFRKNEKLVVHRIMECGGGQVVTRGDARAKFDAPVSYSEMLGKVERVVRDGRAVRMEQSFGQHVASAIFRRSDLCTRVTGYLGRRIRRPLKKLTSRNEFHV